MQSGFCIGSSYKKQYICAISYGSLVWRKTCDLLCPFHSLWDLSHENFWRCLIPAVAWLLENALLVSHLFSLLTSLQALHSSPCLKQISIFLCSSFMLNHRTFPPVVESPHLLIVSAPQSIPIHFTANFLKNPPKYDCGLGTQGVLPSSKNQKTTVIHI